MGKPVIIGMAGHVDHGKTALVKALTGQDTDRLAEEKKRGMSIELGFAWADIPWEGSILRVGIIDVPGHERFLKNMLAGVCGMDIALLVVAADEGVMPQTREHFEILRLAGVKSGLVALSKADLCGEEQCAGREGEIRQLLSGSFMEKAPVVRVDAIHGIGIEELRRNIAATACGVQAAEDEGMSARLSIDRIFSVPGAGTVATGTLLSDTMKIGDRLRAYPGDKECLVRSIQVYGEAKESCQPGMRCALNLSGIRKDELKRGEVLAPPDSMVVTRMLDVSLQVLSDSPHSIKNRQRLHMYLGSASLLCRAVLPGGQEVKPGESAYAQLRLEEPLAARRGDRFILRFFSPLSTVGGGVVLDAFPVKRSGAGQEIAERLSALERADTASYVSAVLAEHGVLSCLKLRQILGLKAEAFKELMAQLEFAGKLICIKAAGGLVIGREQKQRLTRLITEALSEYHDLHPYRHGIRRAELINLAVRQGHVPEEAAGGLVRYMEGAEEIKTAGEWVSLQRFRPLRDDNYGKIMSNLMNQLQRAGYQFIRFSQISWQGREREDVEDILQLALESGKVVRLKEDYYTTGKLMEPVIDFVKETLENGGAVTVIALKEAFSTSRKNVWLMLHYLDRIGATGHVETAGSVG